MTAMHEKLLTTTIVLPFPGPPPVTLANTLPMQSSCILPPSIEQLPQPAILTFLQLPHIHQPTADCLDRLQLRGRSHHTVCGPPPVEGDPGGNKRLQRAHLDVGGHRSVVYMWGPDQRTGQRFPVPLRAVAAAKYRRALAAVEGYAHRRPASAQREGGKRKR